MNPPIPPGPHPFGNLPAAQQAEVLALVRQHKKIEAIKLYRELVPSAGLAAAKAVVDALSDAPAAPSSVAPHQVDAAAPPLPLSPAQEQELLSLLQRRQKIVAIKRYRELRPGTELMEARKAVEALEIGRASCRERV